LLLMFIFLQTPTYLRQGRINWEFQAFYLPKTVLNVSGFQNNVRLALPITKIFRFTLTHQYLYNSHVEERVFRENSMLLFGIMIKK